MALSDSISKVINTDNRCAVAKLIDAMPEPDKSVFIKALADEKIPSRPLTKALRLEGYQMGDETLLNHRNKKCRCVTKK